MKLLLNKFQLKKQAWILIAFMFLFVKSTASCQNINADFSEIHLFEPQRNEAFINVINNENVDFEQDNFNKNNYKLNLQDESDLKGSIEIKVKEDKTVFSDSTKESLDAKADLSKSLNKYMDINTDISVSDFNNYSGSQAVPSISNLNVSTEILPHHKLYIGQTRIQEDNSPSLVLFNTVENKYGLKTFESAEDIDLKLTGSSGLLDYSAGAYNLNSSDDNSLTNKETITGGWATFKPLQAMPQTGSLEMGGGYFTNQLAKQSEVDQENTYSVFTGYKLKRYYVKGEFMRKDYGYSENQYSDSFHFCNKFSVTDNIDLKAGFQQFKETKSTINDFGIEYSMGDNFSLEKDKLKLELNASFRRYQEMQGLDSQRLGIKTKYFF